MSSPPPIRAIVFDLDNTLVDRQRAAARWALQQVRQHGPGRSLAERRSVVWQFLDRDQWGRRPQQALGWLAESLQALESPAFTWPSFQRELPRWVRAHRQVKDLLQWLTRSQVPIAIGTNGGQQVQRQKMLAAGLDAFPWRCVLISQQLGTPKPSAEFFRELERRLSLAPNELLMVGDDWENDICGALDQGWQACWLSYDRPQPRAWDAWGDWGQTRGWKVNGPEQLAHWLRQVLPGSSLGRAAC